MGVYGQHICYHVATFRDANKFDMQYDHVLKKLNFDLLTPPLSVNFDLWTLYQGQGEVAGLWENVCYHVATFREFL